MCGIIGYIGSKPAQPILLAGLARMEYRGYDSAGIATLHDNALHIVKAKGKVAVLGQKLDDAPQSDTIGIGHTRWATHGEPSERNAHPHQANKIAVVHNGIIENYKELKEELRTQGVAFASDTDTEVLAWLIESYYATDHDMVKSVQSALRRVNGTFGLAVVAADDPGRIIVARRGSPLQIGTAGDGTYIASDVAALVGYVDEVVYMADNQLAVCTAHDIDVYNLDLESQTVQREKLELELDAIQKQGYDHFLLKEIMEQPESVAATLRGRLDIDSGTSHLGGLNMSDEHIRDIERFVIIGCGTASYAGMLGKYMIERLTGIPVDVEVASEFRYRGPVVQPNSVAVFISQSGETADTLACVEEMKRRGIHTLGVVNVVGSTIARTVDGGIYLHAGPEISVASTKAFTSQVSALLLLGLHVARRRELSVQAGKEVVEALLRLPRDISAVLKQRADIKKLTAHLSTFDNAFFLGRDTLYPIALEGAIKLKEVSYIHAEAYPAGEAKHGPIALVGKDMLIVFLLGKGPLAEKAQSNLQEMKARGGTVFAITDGGEVPDAAYSIQAVTHSPWTAPLVVNVIQQLLAYYAAVNRGCDVDQPRNLAKSVTVE